MKHAKPLRVLIIRNAYQKDAGGAEQYALNLAIALKNAGHKPILVTKVKKIHKKGRDEKIKVISGPWHDSQIWDRWYYLRYPLFTLWYLLVILRYRIDIVHPQSRDDFVFATRAGHLLRKPVIWTDHADLKYILDDVNHYNPRLRGWVIRAARHAQTVICASNNEKKEIASVAPELTNLKVVHNGVFVPQAIKPVPKTNQAIVGTNARLVPAKGISELIEGFAAIKNDHIDLWLLGGLSGNKPKYQALTKKLKVASRVKFLDYVPNPNDYIASMDVFVHASYHEAFSLAIIEAAMLARPIIATGVGGTPEIISQSCGILIEPKSPQAITDALRALLADKAKRQKLGKAAKAKALKDFDMQKIVQEQIVPLYQGTNK
jgi:glycosyltransferase involved in cell wall biosynthesis